MADEETPDEELDVEDLEEEFVAEPEDLEEALVVDDEGEEDDEFEELDEEDEEEQPETDERGDGTGRIQPKRPGEFVCQSCFLVKHPSQLADPDQMLCTDCV